MMRFNLSELAVREQSITLFMIIAVVIAGIYAFLHLGRAEDPAYTVKVMTVTAYWPGATAEEMQQQVGDKLEKRLQELRYYDRVETTAHPGYIVLKVILSNSTPPYEVAEEFYQTRKKLTDEKINLPQGVIGPIFNDEYSDVYFTLYALEAKNLPHRQLVLEAEKIRQRLLRVQGVGKVILLGEQPQKIFVDISYRRLATLGISAQQLYDAISRQNDVAAAGFVETNGPRVYLRLDGNIDSVETVKNIPIAAEGRILKIGDIADVRRGYEDPATYLIRRNGEPILMVGVIMKPAYNGLSLGEALDKEEIEIKKQLPLGFHINKVADQAQIISGAFNEFMLKFVIALAVVIGVSLLTLGWHVGIVVAAAVPLTLAVVFIIMLATGSNFDRITLGALILSLGLLVDDAIIAIEMMVVKMEEGVDRLHAAAYAWTSTAAPMLSGTLVTIIGLMPVGFAQSTAGEYAGNIFWVVAYSLITSWFVAVFFTPYLGYKLLPVIEPVAGGHEAIYTSKNYNKLRAIIRACVDHKWIAFAITIGLFLLALAGMEKVQKQFFPTSDRPELTININMPPGSSFEATDKMAKIIEEAIMKEPEAKIVTSYVGAGSPRFFLSFDPELPNPSYAQLIVFTVNAQEREALKTKVRQMINNGDFPQARVRATEFLFGPPVPFPVLFRVIGPDLNEVRKIAEQVRVVMEQNPHMEDVHLDWGERTAKLQLVLDQERLRLLGLTPKEAALQLQSLLNGVTVTQVRENLRTVDLLLRSPAAEHRTLKDIGDITLTTKDGKSIPLSQVASLEPRMEDAVLKRYGRDTYIAVQGDVKQGFQPPDITNEILPLLEPIKQQLPDEYRIDTGGAVGESEQANEALFAVFPVMIIFMLFVIMLQVRSFSAMFLVFATAPLGLIGAVPVLLIFNQPFGFTAILGLIGLAGILMRNTLILVDQIQQDKANGLNDYDAVIESTVRRARPVILTALAALLAFIPLTHSHFWGQMAYVLIGGVGIGTFLTLLFLPSLYAIWFKVQK